MIVYSGTKSRFHSDVMSNDIGNIIYNAFQGATGRRTNRAEINSWTNSLIYMHNVLEDPAIPAAAGVAIEYHIPRSSKRIDFILTGTDAANADTAVLVELKQWQQATLTAKDAVVVTPFSGKPQVRPGFRARHNYASRPGRKAGGDFSTEIAEAGSRTTAMRFMRDFIKLQGNQEFVMVDDQKIVHETALALAARAATGTKQVLIVEGGPGTGKSVVAVNLLADFYHISGANSCHDAPAPQY